MKSSSIFFAIPEDMRKQKDIVEDQIKQYLNKLEDPMDINFGISILAQILLHPASFLPYHTKELVYFEILFM